jgi:hypothetical protein
LPPRARAAWRIQGMTTEPTPQPPPQSRTTIAPSPRITGRQIVEGVVDAIAIIAVFALAWKYERILNIALGLIAVLAGVRLKDLVSGGGGGGNGDGGAGGSISGLFPIALALGRSVFGAHARSAATLALVGAVLLSACSGTQVQQEMRAADAIGLGANHLEPAWIAVMNADGEIAADAVCRVLSDDACVGRRLDAVHAVIAHWSHVRNQWEIAREAHDRYAGCLEAANRTDGGICPDGDARRAALGSAVLLLRCEFRAVGHPELDTLGGGAITCPFDAADAGGDR